MREKEGKKGTKRKEESIDINLAKNCVMLCFCSVFNSSPSSSKVKTLKNIITPSTPLPSFFIADNLILGHSLEAL